MSIYKEFEETSLFEREVEGEFYPRTSTPYKDHLQDGQTNNFVRKLSQFPRKFVVHGVQNAPRGMLCGNIVMEQTTEKSGHKMILKKKHGQKKDKTDLLENDNFRKQKCQIRHMRI